MIKNLFELWFKTRHRSKQNAQHIRQRLAIFYAFVGWNTFGIFFYMIMKKELPKEAHERRAIYRDLTGVPDRMYVYQAEGLSITNEFPYDSKTAQMEKDGKSKSTTANTDEH